MSPILPPLAIMTIGQVITFLLGKWIEKRKWEWKLSKSYGINVAGPGSAASLRIINRKETFMPKDKAPPEVYHVTSISAESALPSLEAAQSKAAEMAKGAPGVPFHVLQSLESVTHAEETA